MLKIEESTEPLTSSKMIEHGDERAAEKRYLLDRMLLAGMITANTATTGPVTHFLKIQLTFAGHDFLDSVRDEVLWAKTKDGAAAAGAFSLDLIKTLAKGFAKKQIEEKTGISLDL